MRKCLSNLILFLPAMTYLAVSLTLNEEHPFSRFAMYSSFPEHSDYYSLSSIDGNPIPGTKSGLISVFQLQDIMTNRLEAANLSHNLLSFSKVGSVVLDSLCSSYQGVIVLNRHQTIHLLYHSISFTGTGLIKHEEFIIAACHVN